MTLPRVLSYPTRHPYVDRLHGQVANMVYRADLPREPDRRIDPSWLENHADRIDLAHLHLGHEHRSTAELVRVMDVLEGCNVPVVATVHEIQVPHRPPPPDVRLLIEVAPRVQRLITLTRGAAAEIEGRVGIRPIVIPHGPVLGSGNIQRARRQRAMFVRDDLPVLLHAGHLNPNLDWQSVVEAARRTRGRRRVRILVQQQQAEQILPVVKGLAFIEVVVLAGLTQGELVAELAAAHCLVLPYRWGTHSGLLELAADVGVPVVATEAGYLDQQHPVLSVPLTAGSADVGHLVRAVDVAADAPGAIVSIQDRERALSAFLQGHRRIYGSVMTRRGLPGSHRGIMAGS
ncbi:MAG TPA: hypothetical protein VMM13_17645 [Euzebya sp.]|nr:hypothetical protein [Euzebya sp.]